MGNLNNPPAEQQQFPLLKDLTLLKTKNDPNYGGKIKIMHNSKDESRLYALKALQFSQREQMERALKFGERRQKLTFPYFIQLIDTQYIKEEQFCGNTYVCEYLLEYFENNLEQEIEQKIQSQQIYAQADILTFIYTVAQSINFLQDNGIYHGSISPDNILCAGEKIYKIFDVAFLQGYSNYDKLVFKITPDNKIYLAPELFQSYQDKVAEPFVNDRTLNQSKCETFSLGLVTLQMALNTQDIQDIYLKNESDGFSGINEEYLEKSLDYIEKQYSTQLAFIIASMLEVNPRIRWDIQQTLAYLYNTANELTDSKDRRGNLYTYETNNNTLTEFSEDRKQQELAEIHEQDGLQEKLLQLQNNPQQYGSFHESQIQQVPLKEDHHFTPQQDTKQKLYQFQEQPKNMSQQNQQSHFKQQIQEPSQNYYMPQINEKQQPIQKQQQLQYHNESCDVSVADEAFEVQKQMRYQPQANQNQQQFTLESLQNHIPQVNQQQKINDQQENIENLQDIKEATINSHTNQNNHSVNKNNENENNDDDDYIPIKPKHKETLQKNQQFIQSYQSSQVSQSDLINKEENQQQKQHYQQPTNNINENKKEQSQQIQNVNVSNNQNISKNDCTHMTIPSEEESGLQKQYIPEKKNYNQKPEEIPITINSYNNQLSSKQIISTDKILPQNSQIKNESLFLFEPSSKIYNKKDMQNILNKNSDALLVEQHNSIKINPTQIKQEIHEEEQQSKHHRIQDKNDDNINQLQQQNVIDDNDQLYQSLEQINKIIKQAQNKTNETKQQYDEAQQISDQTPQPTPHKPQMDNSEEYTPHNYQNQHLHQFYNNNQDILQAQQQQDHLNQNHVNQIQSLQGYVSDVISTKDNQHKNQISQQNTDPQHLYQTNYTFQYKSNHPTKESHNYIDLNSMNFNENQQNGYNTNRKQDNSQIDYEHNSINEIPNKMHNYQSQYQQNNVQQDQNNYQDDQKQYYEQEINNYQKGIDQNNSQDMEYQSQIQNQQNYNNDNQDQNNFQNQVQIENQNDQNDRNHSQLLQQSQRSPDKKRSQNWLTESQYTQFLQQKLLDNQNKNQEPWQDDFKNLRESASRIKKEVIDSQKLEKNNLLQSQASNLSSSKKLKNSSCSPNRQNSRASITQIDLVQGQNNQQSDEKLQKDLLKRQQIEQIQQKQIQKLQNQQKEAQQKQNLSQNLQNDQQNNIINAQINLDHIIDNNGIQENQLNGQESPFKRSYNPISHQESNKSDNDQKPLQQINANNIKNHDSYNPERQKKELDINELKRGQTLNMQDVDEEQTPIKLMYSVFSYAPGENDKLDKIQQRKQEDAQNQLIEQENIREGNRQQSNIANIQLINHQQQLNQQQFNQNQIENQNFNYNQQKQNQQQQQNNQYQQNLNQKQKYPNNKINNNQQQSQNPNQNKNPYAKQLQKLNNTLKQQQQRDNNNSNNNSQQKQQGRLKLTLKSNYNDNSNSTSLSNISSSYNKNYSNIKTNQTQLVRQSQIAKNGSKVDKNKKNTKNSIPTWK